MKKEIISTPLLDTREAMLDTLHTAYLFVLGALDVQRGGVATRLDSKDERKLGRRLAEYYTVKTNEDKAPSLKHATDAFVAAQAAMMKAEEGVVDRSGIGAKSKPKSP